MQIQERTKVGSALYNLLADMAQNPQKFEKYKNNIESFMAEYDLTEEQKTLIRRGGEAAYIELLVKERAKHFGDYCV
ncbi:hypothetical protein [[Phormidium] sp. ETS-05]|uniref:hypothetical protein n=1 Tax=[Phormidium] sp. ETS-05 TaxID=222819 RepID=UPI0018EEFE95|nr:hypothetical protein [[Phormidium] sp. ETS-05]